MQVESSLEQTRADNRFLGKRNDIREKGSTWSYVDLRSSSMIQRSPHTLALQDGSLPGPSIKMASNMSRRSSITGSFPVNTSVVPNYSPNFSNGKVVANKHGLYSTPSGPSIKGSSNIKDHPKTNKPGTIPLRGASNVSPRRYEKAASVKPEGYYARRTMTSRYELKGDASRLIDQGDYGILASPPVNPLNTSPTRDLITTVPTRSIVTLQQSGSLLQSSSHHSMSSALPYSSAAKKESPVQHFSSSPLVSPDIQSLTKPAVSFHFKKNAPQPLQQQKSEVLTITRKSSATANDRINHNHGAQGSVLAPGLSNNQISAPIHMSSRVTFPDMALNINVQSKDNNNYRISPSYSIQSARTHTERQHSQNIGTALSSPFFLNKYNYGDDSSIWGSRPLSGATTNYVYLHQTQAQSLHDTFFNLKNAFTEKEPVSKKYISLLAPQTMKSSAKEPVLPSIKEENSEAEKQDNTDDKPVFSSKSSSEFIDKIKDVEEKKNSDATDHNNTDSSVSTLLTDSDNKILVETEHLQNSKNFDLSNLLEKQEDLSDLISLLHFFKTAQIELAKLGDIMSESIGKHVRPRKTTVITSVTKESPVITSGKKPSTHTLMDPAQPAVCNFMKLSSSPVILTKPSTVGSTILNATKDNVTSVTKETNNAVTRPVTKTYLQEYLYSLEIDTKNGREGETRCVDVISISKSPAVLLMTDFLTASECSKIKQTFGAKEASIQLLKAEPGVAYIIKALRRRLAIILNVRDDDIQDFLVMKIKPDDVAYEEVLPFGNVNFLIFLDGPAAAGGLDFEDLGIHVEPRIGTAVAWANPLHNKQQLSSKLLTPHAVSSVVMCKIFNCSEIGTDATISANHNSNYATTKTKDSGGPNDLSGNKVHLSNSKPIKEMYFILRDLAGISKAEMIHTGYEYLNTTNSAYEGRVYTVFDVLEAGTKLQTVVEEDEFEKK